MPELSAWDSFYVIVGPSAGALIGLQFVVLTLVADRPPPNAAQGGAAFATPTVIHFSSVLFLSAVVRAPWHSIAPLAVIWALVGVAGVVYSGIIIRRMRSLTTYQPLFEDWAFHAVLPFVAYALLALSAVAAPSHLREALFGVGAAALLLLFIGIHNVWDGIAYHVFVNLQKPGD